MIPTSVFTGKKDAIIEKFEVGDFYLASPNQTMLGKGTFATITQYEQTKDFPERLQTLLDEANKSGVENAVAVGAIPFDYRKPVKLTIPRQTILSSKYEKTGELISTEDETDYDFHYIPEPSEYMKGVEKGIEKIKCGELDKIVLGRVLELTASRKVDVGKILRELAEHNTSGYTFAADISGQTEPEMPNRTIIGASPELLVSKRGNIIFANPLAGSRRRSEDPAEDRRRAEELLQSQKDLQEHAVVVKEVKKSLEALCESLVVPEKPSLVKTETMWHLSTEIKGEVKDPSITSLSLAYALHPTPAVCGSPTDKAREEIREIESFDREYFTGMVGWCDQAGDGEWVVTIRCAEVQDRTMRLFAGAGIVADSKPEEELAETSAKLRTMLAAMDLHHFL